jgi:hypothetical protein
MRSFAVTWDYRCPFARNAHEHVLDALAGGAEWEVTFAAFSLNQVHVGEGDADVWDAPDEDSGLLALRAGVAVRDHFADRFQAVHRALFAARHDEGRDLRDEQAVRDVLTANGVDADAVMALVRDGTALKAVRADHESFEAGHHVWGVPTFISGERAVFVRLMDRPDGDTERARSSIERVLDLLDGWPELNEYKWTHIPR